MTRKPKPGGSQIMPRRRARYWRAKKIAQLLNISPRRVRQLAERGVIPRTARGWYEPVPAALAYVRYLQELIR